MKHTILVFATAALIVGFAGCSRGKTEEGSLTHGGIKRDFTVYVPPKYGSNPVPLLLNLHGYTSTAQEQMYYGDFRTIADTANFIIVLPQGTVYEGKTHWNTGGWTPNSTVDDLGFIDALIDHMSKTYKIDTTRIYATGMSNGGEMSYHLACNLGNRIAAIAPVSGAMTPETFAACSPTHPTPVMHIHGTADDVVPYGGDSTATPIARGLEYWTKYNQCDINPTRNSMPNISAADSSTVEHYVYKGPRASVEHFKVIGGGHAWPGAVYPAKGTNHDINASLEIWRFLSRYDLNGLRK